MRVHAVKGMGMIQGIHWCVTGYDSMYVEVHRQRSPHIFLQALSCVSPYRTSGIVRSFGKTPAGKSAIYQCPFTVPHRNQRGLPNAGDVPMSYVGCWLSVVCCRLLIVGCWLLVMSCWLLVVGGW